MPPQGRPRATKPVTSWQAKQQPKPKKKEPRQRIKRSNHPVVKLLKDVEKDGPVNSDIRQAAIAGFQAEHCGGSMSKESRVIAAMKLPNGNMKRVYACDVCGSVVSKETMT